MKNRLVRSLLIILVGVSFWWLLIAADRGVAPAKPVHIDALRALAATLPGRPPTGVDYTLLATRNVVGDFYAVGSGLKRRPLAVVAWTLPVPGTGPIMIDPGAPPPEAGAGEFANFDHAAQGRIDSLARSASLRLYTQVSQSEPTGAVDHLGEARSSMRKAADRSVGPLSFSTAQAVAPGVVVIPASTHAPGARLIFVQLADRREFLFVGNLAMLGENWTRLRARSHLAALWGPAQNRSETYAWLRTIRQLKIEAPQLKIVPGYDYVWLIGQQSEGAISRLPPGATSLTMASAGTGRRVHQLRQIAR